MGYHNEHHDFAAVPWNNLPKIKEQAPEYYDSLKSYQSWTAVLYNYIFNPKMSSYSRIVHPATNSTAETNAGAEATDLFVASDRIHNGLNARRVVFAAKPTKK